LDFFPSLGAGELLGMYAACAYVSLLGSLGCTVDWVKLFGFALRFDGAGGVQRVLYVGFGRGWRM